MISAVVWFEADPAREFSWCVLRRAVADGHVTSLCLVDDPASEDGAIPYRPLLVSTERPVGLACPACDRELAAGTPGAAMALEREPARTTTRDLRRGAG